MTAQAALWWGAGAAAAICALAGFAEYRRTRRRDLDRVGWTPWNAIHLIAFFTALALVAAAFNLGK